MATMKMISVMKHFLRLTENRHGMRIAVISPTIFRPTGLTIPLSSTGIPGMIHESLDTDATRTLKWIASLPILHLLIAAPLVWMTVLPSSLTNDMSMMHTGHDLRFPLAPSVIKVLSPATVPSA
jgi:hypothetical protein